MGKPQYDLRTSTEEYGFGEVPNRSDWLGYSSINLICFKYITGVQQAHCSYGRCFLARLEVCFYKKRKAVRIMDETAFFPTLLQEYDDLEGIALHQLSGYSASEEYLMYHLQHADGTV